MPDSDVLVEYPHIFALHQRRGGDRGAMQQLCEYGDFSLSRLDTALSRLQMDQRPSLRGLVDDLFSHNFKTVYAAICEILSFDWLKGKGVLAECDIGYPFDWDGEDPPFDGVLRFSDRQIPFDVKNGSGSGLSLLESVIQTEVEKLASNSGVKPPQVHVALNAPSGKRWLHDNFAAIVHPFRQDINDQGLYARTIELQAGSGSVRIGIGRRVGGNIIGLEEKASFVAAQILQHASEKVNKLHHTTADECLLMYLKRPGSGSSDFDEKTVACACDFLASVASLPDVFVGFTFVAFEYSGTELRTSSFLWDRFGHLPGALRSAVNKIHIAKPKISLEERQETARRLHASDVEVTSALFAGSCDLRGKGCHARGSIGAVFVYFYEDDLYNACDACRQHYGWPKPTAAA